MAGENPGQSAFLSVSPGHETGLIFPRTEEASPRSNWVFLRLTAVRFLAQVHHPAGADGAVVKSLTGHADRFDAGDAAEG
jgi:hypothetical protein